MKTQQQNRPLTQTEQVEFRFIVQNYYRDRALSGNVEHLVKGTKTLRLFKSWFNLMKNKGRLKFGTLRFTETGETWLWQPRNRVGRGGWQRCGIHFGPQA